MIRKIHWPFLIITVLSLSASVLSFLIQGETESVVTMLKVLLPFFAGIVAVLLVAKRFRG